MREPGYDPAGADRLFDAAGWRRGADGMRRRGGMRLQLTYVQFPETPPACASRRPCRRRCAQRGIDVAVKSDQQRAALPAAARACSRRGTFDMAYVPWTMGADPDDSSVLGCGAPSNYMRWCDPQVERLEARGARGDSIAGRAQAALRANRPDRRARKCRSSTFSMPTTSTRIASACTASRRTRSCRRGTPTLGGCTTEGAGEFPRAACERRS